MISLDFWGAAETVTGSKYLVTAGSDTVLVDCGLFQGVKKLRRRNWEPPPFDPGELDAVVLTHAHIDHSGYLPRMIDDGFDGPIFCTDATRDLLEILLPDAGYLQEEQAEYANRQGFSKHEPARPLYTRRDAERSLENLESVAFGDHDAGVSEAFQIGDIACRFAPAGHILGAARVELSVDGRTLVFSGDVGRPNAPIMRPPKPIFRADALVLESTYGDRRHPDVEPAEQLAEVVRRTAGRGGIVLIPSFAVGRAQALMHLLCELEASARIPDLPIFLNSPMAVDVTRLYERHESQHRLSHEQCEAMFRDVRFVNDVEESKRLNERRDPAVIISASGMATGGRVVHHLKSFAPDERNTVAFAGFQAPGTRGDAMVHGAEEIKIHGEYVPVEAEVVEMRGLSAHADYREIGDWLESVETPPARVFLTHGEPAAADAMRRYVRDRFGWDCRIPEYGERVDLF